MSKLVNKNLQELSHRIKESFNNECPSNYASTRPFFTLENARMIVENETELYDKEITYKYGNLKSNTEIVEIILNEQKKAIEELKKVDKKYKKDKSNNNYLSDRFSLKLKIVTISKLLAEIGYDEPDSDFDEIVKVLSDL